LGLYPDKKYGETKIHVNNGSSIVVYTDGVTELQDENNLQYGNQKLEENLQNLTGMNPKEMIVKIEKSLQLFIGETKQSDDISMLILKYKP
jgi:sigma-B regulation protein RsbU (phosphoserine phosphatase)